MISIDGDSQPQGCMGKAYNKTNPVLDKFKSELEDAQRRFESDPRVVKADATWSACMRRSGYDVRKPDDVIDKLLFPAQMKIFGAPGQNTKPKAGDGPVRIEMVAPTPAKIEEFRKVELAIARADADCSPATDVRATVRAEYEQDFIDKHRDELDKALAES